MQPPKSSVEQIRARFDADVERFSNLETGQSATMDAAFAMDLVARAAAAVTPAARHVIDVGCGAGNYTLKLLAYLPGLDVTLVDLSRSMLDRAVQRVAAATPGAVRDLQGDVREIPLEQQSCDIVLAAAVLHHLRSEAEWQQVFATVYAALRPGGAFWIFDLVTSDLPDVQTLMWDRYGQYLQELRGADYRAEVFRYIEAEDTPRSLVEQLDLLRQVGFAAVEVLHKNTCFAAFGGYKA